MIGEQKLVTLGADSANGRLYIFSAMFRFTFNEEKAAQAAAFLIVRHGGKINLMALLKLLYLADRRSLIERGQTITGDKMVSMPHGPVLSRIYDNANWGKSGGEARPWCRYISDRANHEVGLVTENPDFDELSEYEMEILTEIDKSHGQLSQWQLRELTHLLPEWTDPEGSSLPIDPADILKFAGLSDDEIRKAMLNAEELYFLRNGGAAKVAG